MAGALDPALVLRDCLHRLTGAPLDRFTGGEFTNCVFRRLGFDILPKGAALNRQARLLRELGGPPYAPPQAGVPARVADLPAVPAVYSMYGGQGAGLYVAYTGVARSLRRRVEQHPVVPHPTPYPPEPSMGRRRVYWHQPARHLILHNSSVTAGASAVALQPDHVREVRWWTHPSFEDRDALEAAELVAFAVFDPVLRSRGAVREGARRRAQDAAFAEEMRVLFAGEPAGRLVIPTLEDALARIEALERRLAGLAERLRGL